MTLINYNGIDLPFSVTEITGRGPLSQEVESVVVQEMPGSLFVSRRLPPRRIGVKFEIVSNSWSDMRAKVDDLTEKLDITEPSPIIFSDQPDKIYYGILEGDTDWDEALFIGKGSLVFFCADPYKYGPEKTVLWPAQETIKADYAGKVAGSTLENPHLYRWVLDAATTSVSVNPNSGNVGELSQPTYNEIASLNGISNLRSSTTNGQMAQRVFSFNLIEFVERKYGAPIPGATTIEKVAWLKTNVLKLQLYWHGKGSGPSGNRASITMWDGTRGLWHESRPSHTNSTITSLIWTISNGTFIDNNGFVHYLAFAETSNGSIASTIETDFVELLTTLNLRHLPSKIDYKGTAETFPIIKAEVTKATSYSAIENQNTGEIMMIGQPVSVEDTVVPYEESILDDSMATLTGWANASFAVDSGQIAGTMQSDSYVFKVQDYGTGSAWHGPAVAKSMSQQLQDFKIETLIKFSGRSAGEVGRVEIYLLDINNAVIGKLAMKDYMTSYLFNMPEIFAINKVANTVESLIVRNANENWNGFYGMLRFQRIGQEISAYLARVNPDTGIHENIKVGSYVDANNQYQSKLAAVGIHIATFGTSTPVSTAQVHHLAVKKINANQPGIPYIALPGDIIEFNHINKAITKNGEDIRDLKAFIAKPFPLVKGINELAVSPTDSLSLEIKFRERFK